MRRKLAVIAAVTMVLSGCATVKQAMEGVQPVQTVKSLQFKLTSVSNFRLSGISLSSMSSYSDLRLGDVARVASDFATERMPVQFTLNTDVRNPNTSSSGFSLVLRDLRWRLVIDTSFAVSGNVTGPLRVPEGGTSVNVPVPMELDLMKTFRGHSLKGLVNLAMAIGGVNGSASRLRLFVQPSVDGPFGAIRYPGEIEVVDKEFR